MVESYSPAILHKNYETTHVKVQFPLPPPYRAMLLVIELKLCSTMLAITVRGEDELLMV
jgi:hypothetical protein